MEKRQNSIFLCGFMGAGKTTLGKSLAQELGWRFLDTDACIEEQHGPIPQIFAQHGEAYFRELEAELAQKLQNTEKTVVSTGGGFMMSPKVQESLNAQTVVYLSVDFEECYRRIAASERPLVKSNTKEALFALYQHRDAIYRSVCSTVIENSGKTQDTVQEIITQCDLVNA